nr:replicative helicase loader/inhibitor [Neobacillus drentensis]
MTKKEIFSLMQLIEVYYEQFKVTQEKLDGWHSVLSKYSYEKLHGNLMEFVVHSPHPPKISDLVQSPSGGGRPIPGRFVLDLTAGEDW